MSDEKKQSAKKAVSATQPVAASKDAQKPDAAAKLPKPEDLRLDWIGIGQLVEQSINWDNPAPQRVGRVGARFVVQAVIELNKESK